MLHYGHLEFLHEAKKQGKYLIVALEPDETIIKSLLGIFPAACGVIWRNEQIYT
ncbi:adenylyltransferase/cytidyltransferase family protein [Rickettsia endosymbiont of Gonocerus acuteangulatus]|uniref:adenylyltransferase/cytidyltransferase family protein n=1 Tax=Rickettsia endosymbiont of Gonocerus acuteangulatus TaxID=3066266 RepID=UPI00397B6CFA